MKNFILRSLVLVAAIFMIAAPVVSAQTQITLWTQEGESDASFAYIRDSIAAFGKTAAGRNVTIELVQKDTEALREDFQNASLAGNAPELLWTVSDHAGPFTLAKLIQPVDKLFDMKKFVPGVVAGVKIRNVTYGVPISGGNHLMLMYNKKFIKTAPKTTDELIKMAQDFMKKNPGSYGLTYNAVEPFWLVPWLGAFGGSVFAADGKTPTLDTDAMVATLQFLADLKFKHKITPEEQDYGVADGLFKEGKAAFLINGDWSLSDYQKALGADFAVAAMPQVKGQEKTWNQGFAAPYTSGKYFMIAAGVAGAKLKAVTDFINFMTSDAKQAEQVTALNRLPGTVSASRSRAITGNPILAGSNAQMTKGTAMPVVAEMRANWDAMKPEFNAVLAGQKTPEEAATAMQRAAIKGIAALYQ